MPFIMNTLNRCWDAKQLADTRYLSMFTSRETRDAAALMFLSSIFKVCSMLRYIILGLFSRSRIITIDQDQRSVREHRQKALIGLESSPESCRHGFSFRSLIEATA